MQDWRDYEGFVDVEECARRMGITKKQVMELVRLRALRAVDFGYLAVEPAILSGI
jgi:hypothetical protein